MSNVEAPNINSSGTNNSDLLAEQSGTPNMSSEKNFTVDTNMKVNGNLDVAGTVIAEAFIGDGSQLTGISGGGSQSEITSGQSFVRFEEADPEGNTDAPENPKLLSIGGDDLWDGTVNVLNDFKIIADDDIILTASDDIELTSSENIELTSIDNLYITSEGKIDLEANEYIELNGEVRIASGNSLRLQDDFDAINPGMESFVQDLTAATSTEVPSAAAVKSVTDDLQSQINNIGVSGGVSEQALSPQYPDISPYYYIYVGDPAVKLDGINDLHYGSDEEYDFKYDQEFDNLGDAFKFVQESNFDSIAWNDWRESWVKTRIVFVLQNGVIFGEDDPTYSYISLSHIRNHIIFTTQYSVHRDRNNQVDHPNIVGHSYVYYDANFSYCPHVHMGGDIAWHWIQSNSSNLIRLWSNTWVNDFHAKYIWAIRGSHVTVEGTVQKIEAEESSYCKMGGIQPCPSILESKLSAAGINTTTSGGPAITSDSGSSVSVETFNSPKGIEVSNGSKATVFTEEDILIGDGTTSGFSYNAITVTENSEIFLNALTFNPNDATAMPNLVINTGTLTDPTPEDNSYITVDWSSKFIRSLPIDDTNAVGVQSIDGEELVRPGLPELP